MDRFLCELKFSFLWDEYCSVQYVGCMVIARLFFLVVFFLSTLQSMWESKFLDQGSNK